MIILTIKFVVYTKVNCCVCVSVCLVGLGLRAVPDEVVLGQMRDWNEELQTARELPTDSPAAKVFRDRTLFKVAS